MNTEDIVLEIIRTLSPWFKDETPNIEEYYAALDSIFELIESHRS